MKHQILITLATTLICIIAAVIVMVIHEIFKSVAYLCYIKIYNKKYNKYSICPGVFKLHRYVDPIGLILAVTGYSIFSKQYPFIIRSKKASAIIGIIGYISCIGTFLITIALYRMYFTETIVQEDYSKVLTYYVAVSIKYLLQYMAYLSCMLLLINIFPLATFDISLIIAAISPIAYLKIRKFDIFYKLIFIIISLLGGFATLSLLIAGKSLGL